MQTGLVMSTTEDQLRAFTLNTTNVAQLSAALSMRYRQGLNDLKLFYTKETSYDLVGKNDANWSGDLNGRKSSKSYYFKYNGGGAALSWGVNAVSSRFKRLKTFSHKRN